MVDFYSMQSREDNALVKWLYSQIGPDKKFKSARQLALAAGRNQNQIMIIGERGTATADVLVDIAKALDVSPLKLFALAGWIPDEEQAKTTLSPRAQKFVDQWQQLSRLDQKTLGRVLEGLLQTTDVEE